MGRRLPWKSNTDAGSAPVQVKETGDEKPALPIEPRISARTTPIKRIHTHRKHLSERLRSPSTSPPPEPPPESFMIPGPLHDDRYRMVEDEFLSTAQLFTAHLHRAEYERLKRLAKQQNADAIRAIERPVVGSSTRLARLRHETFRRTQRQHEQLRQEAAQGAGSATATSPSPPPPRMSTGLLGLMDTPVPKRSIRPLPLAISTTRAAAGFGSSNKSPAIPSRSPSSLPVQRRVPAPEQDRHSNSSRVEIDNDGPSSSAVVRGTTSKPSTKSVVIKPTRPPTIHQTNEVEVEDDEDDPFGIQQRRMRREKSREQLRKAAKPKPTDSPDVIPTFW